jgi:hypothetical protein
MDSIVDHRKDEKAAPKDDEYVVVSGNRSRKKPLMNGKSTSNGRMRQLPGNPSKR